MKKYFLILIFVTLLPVVLSQQYIESDIDQLFLNNEEMSFFVKLNNPTKEILDSRLQIELISSENRIDILKERVYIYPGDFLLKDFRKILVLGDYKIIVLLKDPFFEVVLDQKILEFRIVNSCNIENICSYNGAYEKCDCGVDSEKRLGNFLIVLFAVTAIGIVAIFYFEMRRRNLLE